MHLRLIVLSTTARVCVCFAGREDKNEKTFNTDSYDARISAISNEVNAQAKRRVGLPEGANAVEVKGKITGKQYALYEIWVDKGDTWEVGLDSSNAYIGYSVKDPSGNKYDFLEEAQVSGYYLIRVDLNRTGAKSKIPAAFILNIKFEMEPAKPHGG